MIPIIALATMFAVPATTLEYARKNPSVPHVVEIPDHDGYIFTSRGPMPSERIRCWRVTHRSPIRALVVPGHELRILYVIERSMVDPVKSPNCGGSRNWTLYVYGWQASSIVREDGTTIARAASLIDGLVKRRIKELLQAKHGEEAGKWRHRYASGAVDDQIYPSFYPHRSPPHIWYDGEYVDEAYFRRCQELD